MLPQPACDSAKSSGLSSDGIQGINDSIRAVKNADIEEHSIKKLNYNKRSSGSIGTNDLAEKIIATAKEYLGVPHCMGGISTRCIDCSGLVMVVFEEFGIQLPHNAQEQSKHGIIIKEKKDLRKGDLLFFHGSYKTSRFITHSAIYMGDNKFIHTSSGNGVSITHLTDPWWKDKYVFGTRLLE